MTIKAKRMILYLWPGPMGNVEHVKWHQMSIVNGEREEVGTIASIASNFSPYLER